PLPGTRLELHGPCNIVTIPNDNWRDTQGAVIAATGLAPTDDLESAIDVTLPPGSYTAIVRGKNNTTGLALVEAYDLDPASASKLVNIATRATVGTGVDVLIAGFTMGRNGGDQRIVVRR